MKDIPWFCRSCTHSLEYKGHSLHCPRCSSEFAIRDHIVFFDAEPDESTGDRTAYERFLLSRSRSNIRDGYAAFQPFNEATRTMQLFTPILNDVLEDGDIILDLGNRTGWSGAELAATFPSQKVVSCWSGDLDVLGHRGYRYWYGLSGKPDNLQIAFIPLNARLPFADNSIKCIHAHDILHHLDLGILLPEIRRVLAEGACAIFPHVHTNDAEPDPWFQRGGTLRSYEAYQSAFNEIRHPDERVYVLGESHLFNSEGVDTLSLQSDLVDHDYNAVVCLFPDKYTDMQLYNQSSGEPIKSSSVLFVNPLITIDPCFGTIEVDVDPESYAGHMLHRHPVYKKRLDERLPKVLDLQSRLLVYWAHKLPNVSTICDRLNWSFSQCKIICEKLRQAEIISVKNIDPVTARLQRSHLEGRDIPVVSEDFPGLLWRRAVECFPDNPCLLMGASGDELSYTESNEVVEAIARRLEKAGIVQGDAVIIADDLHAEVMLFIWACMMRAVTIIVCSPEGKVPTIDKFTVKAVFAQDDRWFIEGAQLIGPDEACPA